MLPHCLSFCHMPYPLFQNSSSACASHVLPLQSPSNLSSLNSLIQLALKTHLSHLYPSEIQNFRWGNLLAGPYHLHMHPFREATISHSQYNHLSSSSYSNLYSHPKCLFSPLGITQHLNNKLVLYMHS